MIAIGCDHGGYELKELVKKHLEEKGQEVKVRLENYPDREFGYLTGKVGNVANIPDGNGLYQVDILFPNGLKTSEEMLLPTNR
ncbi:MAG: RpiB/LacA/LacB family sugar-phosphate isomerase, partial [Lachnospiraceae bacterium]|nr:RpiB/LacA/LacB family sugar-phosphate isomerase [Lachnospiraceae bacterium]